MYKLMVAAVTGANSGLGAAICRALEQHMAVIPVNGPECSDGYDLTDPVQCDAAARFIHHETFLISEDPSKVYPILINCAGVNYIEWFPKADFAQFDRLMDINCKSGLQLIQNLLGRADVEGHEDECWWYEGGAILNIISNASHMPMTNSAFYNASKGAMHIATLALARELRKTHGITVFGVAPNKLAGTGMSDYIEARVPDLRGWTPEQAAAYQLAALPAGRETDPARLAEFIAFLLSEPGRHEFLTNTVIPYGA